MEPLQIRTKLEQACGAAGHRLHDVPSDPHCWEVMLAGEAGQRLTVRHTPSDGLIRFSAWFAVPPARDLSGLGPDGPAAFRRVVVDAATSRDPLLRAEGADGQGDLTVVLPIHEDGFTVQEVLRAFAALGRIPAQVRGAAEGFSMVAAQSATLGQALDRAARQQSDFDQVLAEIDSLAGEAAGGPAPAVWTPAAPAPPPTAARCPACGLEAAPGTSFCANCGTALAAAPPPPAPPRPPAEIRCVNPACGRVIPAGKRFCSACGTPAPV